MSIGSIFSSAAKWVSNLFSNNQKVIQTVVTDVKIAATIASSVATIAGEKDAVKFIGLVNDGVSVLGVAAANGASASTLTEHAANIAAAVNTLVEHGDVGVKNAGTKAEIAKVADKAVSAINVVQGIAGTL